MNILDVENEDIPSNELIQMISILRKLRYCIASVNKEDLTKILYKTILERVNPDGEISEENSAYTFDEKIETWMNKSFDMDKMGDD